MINTISVKCPNCDATLEIEEGRRQAFCTYCGAKIIINNENEYVYRRIDEAKVRQAETDRMIRLKELELEEQRQKRELMEEEKSQKIYRVLVIGWAVATAILLLIGILQKGEGPALAISLCIGLWGVVLLFNNKDNKEEKKTKMQA